MKSGKVWHEMWDVIVYRNCISTIAGCMRYWNFIKINLLFVFENVGMRVFFAGWEKVPCGKSADM